MRVKPPHVAAGVFIAVAAGVAYLATRSAGNVQFRQYTETHRGPLQYGVVSTDELNMSRTFNGAHWPMHYPSQVAAGISQLIANGFAPLWRPADPVVAAMPAEGAGT